jgi:hypothetical protein
VSWAKLDDAYPTHPKVIAAGPDGMALDVAAICYANRYRTDGIIPAVALPALAPGARNARKVAAKLVEVGRWHADGHGCADCPQPGDGWVIHHFLDFNPSAAEVEEQSRKRAEAGSKGGTRSKPTGSKTEASASDGEEAERKQSRSSPRASPTPPHPSEDSGESSRASGSRSSPDDDFSEEVCALTRHLGQCVKANGHKTPDPATKAAYGWFNAIDKLLRLDGADASEVREVIEWATADEFWRANVRSAAKFRDQYSQLRLQRQRQPQPQANGAARGREPPRPAGHEPNLSDEPVTAKRVQP